MEKTTCKTLIEIMIKITNKTNEEQIFKIINENFSQLAPSYYSLVTHWFINAYRNPFCTNMGMVIFERNSTFKCVYWRFDNNFSHNFKEF